jgi:thymidylate synthase
MMAEAYPLTANNVWLDLIEGILERGSESAPRNIRIKEILSNTTVVDMRYPIVTLKERKIGFKFLAAEAWWIISGRNDVASIAPYSRHIASFSNDGYRFDGAYGPKVVDQLRYVVDTLAGDMDSRQAVLEIWRPNPRQSKDVPCTLTLQWLIRDGCLHCIDSMRSSDAWLGWPYDVFNFSMLSAYVLLSLKKNRVACESVRLGKLYLTAGSSHLYIAPAKDGAANIPYSCDDVRRVLDSHRSPISDRSNFSAYAPFDDSYFSDPDELLVHLERCKDGRGNRPWLWEFQTHAATL